MPIVPSIAISAFCGLIRYPVKKFVLLSLFGTFIRSTLMALIGWQTRGVYIIYADFIEKVETFVLIGLMMIVALFIFWRIIKNKRAKISPR